MIWLDLLRVLVQEVVPVVEVVREDYLDVLQSRLSGLGILSDLILICIMICTRLVFLVCNTSNDSDDDDDDDLS